MMKRLASVGFCLLALAAGVSAQTTLVKETKKALGGAKDYKEFRSAVETLTPAFTNPETATNAETYFIPGEAAFKLYDNYLVATQLGAELDHNDVGGALMDGYNFFLKALPLDSLPNEKGQVKPRFSKKIAGIMAGHVNDFDQVAVGFWQAKNFPAAYRAWDACIAVSTNPVFIKESGMKERPDSVIAQLRYNQALAAWQGEMLPEALKAFDQALSMGNNDPQAYEYAYSVAYQAQDTEHMNKFSHEGFKRFGDSDPKFLQWAVNGYIDNKDFDTAAAMLEDAIAKNPDNPFYYSSYGILNESLGKMDEAEKNYAKAIELDPNVAQVQMNMGRILAEKYDALDEAAGNLSQAEYGKYNAETLIPLLKESAKYFEAAYALDNENTMPLKYLKNIYYRLDDGANLKRVEDLLKY